MAEVKYLRNVADVGEPGDEERLSVRVEISQSPEDIAFFEDGFLGVVGKPSIVFLKSKVTGIVLQQFYPGDKDIGPDEAFEDYYFTVFTEDGNIHWVTLTGSAPPNAWLNHELIA